MSALRTTTLLAAVLLTVLAALPSLAAGRVALVVGNGAYEHSTPLPNPANDAADVAAALKGLGFAVIEGLDLDRTAFEAKLREFARAARGAEAALFFYAGHGLQVEGRNYLLPVDARLSEEVDLEFEALELRAFLKQMRSRANLVFLDACRDNPLAQDLARSMGASRSAAIGRGLGRVDAASGTLIAYATQPGNVAADGKGRNSPFTTALLEHIDAPGRSVNDLLTAVTDDVATGTGGRQQPWTHSSLRKPFYFKAREAKPEPAPVAATTAATPATGRANGSARLTAEQLAAERVFWETVKDSRDPADVEAYRTRYPGGTYEALAVNRQERLKWAADEPAGETVAAVAPQAGAAPAAPSSQPSPEAVESSLGLGRSERRSIQAGLASLGFDPGPADGLFGRKMRAALSAWQAAKGEVATGWLTSAEAGVLKAAGEEASRALAEAERKERAEAERKERQQQAAVAVDTDGCTGTTYLPHGHSQFVASQDALNEDIKVAEELTASSRRNVELAQAALNNQRTEVARLQQAHASGYEYMLEDMLEEFPKDQQSVRSMISETEARIAKMSANIATYCRSGYNTAQLEQANAVQQRDIANLRRIEDAMVALNGALPAR